MVAEASISPSVLHNKLSALGEKNGELLKGKKVLKKRSEKKRSCGENAKKKKKKGKKLHCSFFGRIYLNNTPHTPPPGLCFFGFEGRAVEQVYLM